MNLNPFNRDDRDNNPLGLDGDPDEVDIVATCAAQLQMKNPTVRVSIELDPEGGRMDTGVGEHLSWLEDVEEAEELEDEFLGVTEDQDLGPRSWGIDDEDEL
ncbi:hypothetical protein ACFWB0_02870 [Rhodococcus sp. NPDC060086]|uniref:hypothetical protein n=1 Tax=Rhodococcus sp. NPDC060086 TaxID=3347055 RepID=UPI00364AA829